MFCCLLCLTCWMSLLHTFLRSWLRVSSPQGKWEQPVCEHPLVWDLSTSFSCNWLKNIISLLLHLRKTIYPGPLVLKWHKRLNHRLKRRLPCNDVSNYFHASSWPQLQLFSLAAVLFPLYKSVSIHTRLKKEATYPRSISFWKSCWFSHRLFYNCICLLPYLNQKIGDLKWFWQKA